MVSRDNWSSDSRRWGYYEEEDEDERFVAPRQGPPPERKPQEPARPQAPADPVETAQQLAAGLAAQSASYPGIAWAVSALEESGRITYYATSNEGMGYLPPGLRWDTRLRHVFGPSVPQAELSAWLGLANPARTAADHYMFLRSRRPGLRLIAIASTEPEGEAVLTMLRSLGSASRPPSDGPAPPAPSATSRLGAVSDGAFAALIAGIPVRQLWVAALDLALDAAQRCEYRRLEPQLAAVLDGLRAGMAAHPAQADHAWRRLWQLTAQAQASRVPDQRLGPVASVEMPFHQAIELCAGFDYTQPFFVARTTAILYSLLRCALADMPLSEEQLAEAVYEHACVAEDAAPARAILARHSATSDDEL